MNCGYRITQHSSSSSSSSFLFASLNLNPPKSHFKSFRFVPLTNNINNTNSLNISSSSLYSPCFHSCSHLASTFSQKEDDPEISSQALSSIAGGVVALGKFDALHIGHRELAIQASKVGPPFLLSFVGMAEVLGWEPRAPIVAKCDRQRVLSSWASSCGNVAPKEFLIDFVGVRHLSPRQFVEKLSNELGVRGVVAGENYRFGYKAAGDASELVKLCEEYGMQACIINSVMDKNQNRDILHASSKKERGQVSSTRVRYALSLGDMDYVSQLLGRQHRLLLLTQNKEEIIVDKYRVSVPKSCLLNLPPNEGVYKNCSLIIGADKLQCKVVIDSTHIHLELGYKDHNIYDACREFLHLGIEFLGKRS